LLAVIVLNGAFGFSQEYKAGLALRALSKFSVPRATVIRDGVQQDVEAAELVPGDICVLEEGVLVPAGTGVQSVTVGALEHLPMFACAVSES